jgi:prevent-host-death family protein
MPTAAHKKASSAKTKKPSNDQRERARKSARSASLKRGALAAAGVGGAVAATKLRGMSTSDVVRLVHGRTMTVSIRDLQRRTGGVLRDIAESGMTAIVTERGRPLAYVIPFGDDAWEEYVVANAPEIVESLDQANSDLREGKTQDLRDLLSELEAERSS